MKNRVRALELFVLTALLLSVMLACKGKGKRDTTTGDDVVVSGSIPESKRDYVGDWQAQGITFSVFSDGTVAYEKKTGGTSKKINGRISKFSGHDIKVSVIVTTITIDVQAPPHLVDGKWTMTVEGDEVTKTGSGVKAASRRLDIERVMKEQYESKGIHVKSTSCPAVADMPSVNSFSCTLVEEDGDTILVQTTLNGTSVNYKPQNAALLDKSRLEAFIVSNMAAKRVTATVDCGIGANLLKPVGSTFTCDALVTKPKVKKIQPKVTVKTDEGSVDTSWKLD